MVDAIKREDLKEIDRLLSAGVDINARGREGYTPLVWARICRSSRSFVHLLEKGADTKPRVYGMYLLYLLAESDEPGNEVYVKAMLDHGADPNIVYYSGTSPCNGETPLFAAAREGNIEVVRILIAGGTKIDHQSDSGTIALDCAAWSKKYETVYELLQAGAKPESPPEEDSLLLGLAEDEVRKLPALDDPWRKKVVAWVEEHGYDLGPAMERLRRKAEIRRREIEENRRKWGD